MRRSRVAPASFAAALLLCFTAALWFFFSLEAAPPVAMPPVLSANPADIARVVPRSEVARRPAVVPEPVPARVWAKPLMWEPGSIETPGFPDERVRLGRNESDVPEELYVQNRLILRKVRVNMEAKGMQISGEVLTDFVADCGQQWLPQGPLVGLKIRIELYHYDTVVHRVPHTQAPEDVSIDPCRPEILVEGQGVTVATHEMRGEFAVAQFALPALTKPLPPGVYRLRAELRFRAQHEKLLEAIKWCSGVFGARVMVDPETLEVSLEPVITNVALHEEVYSFLVDTLGSLHDEARIDVGRMLEGGTVRLVSPDIATPARPANLLVRDLHHSIVAQLLEYEDQIDNIGRQKTHRPRPAEADMQRILRDNEALILRHGGRVTGAEHRMLEKTRAALLPVLTQIADSQDWLALQYWIMCDGLLQYAGWNSMYNPGYAVADAIQQGELPARAARGLPLGKWTNRREQWKYVPVEMRDIAFEYLRKKEETDVWDAANFTTLADGSLSLDVTKWAKLRDAWLAEFTTAYDAGAAPLDTTRQYAVQVWPQAFEKLGAMRDEVLLLAWSWEFYIRTTLQAEAEAEVIGSWTDAPNTLQESLATRATAAPGKVKTRFDEAMKEVKTAAELGNFMSRYAKAVEAGIAPPGRE